MNTDNGEEISISEIIDLIATSGSPEVLAEAKAMLVDLENTGDEETMAACILRVAIHKAEGRLFGMCRIKIKAVKPG